MLLCYYRDDRVMVSLGLEARPPFPKGHVLEQGDWSLLDPVRGPQALLAPGVVGAVERRMLQFRVSSGITARCAISVSISLGL